jgi:Leucine-rich repeat (LRR) protein
MQRLALPGSPLEALLAMSNLQDLTLTGCAEAVCLDALAGLLMLKQLKFLKNTNIKRLSIVRWPSNLVALSLTMSRIDDLSPLAHARYLKTLDLSQNTAIIDIEPLAQLQELNRLALGGCTGLKNIEALFSLKSLRLLNLMGCTGLEEAQLTALKKQLPLCKMIYMSRTA